MSSDDRYYSRRGKRGNHLGGRMSRTGDWFHVGARVSQEREEPRKMPRSLACTLVWLVVSSMKMRNSEEEQIGVGKGLRLGLDMLNVRWKHPSGNVQLTVEYKRLELGDITVEVVFDFYVLVNR